MSVLYFFPFNILFVFILTNIFLAIINQTYQEAGGQIQSKDHDDISIVRSIFYMFLNKTKSAGGPEDTKSESPAKVGTEEVKQDYLEVFDKLGINFEQKKFDISDIALTDDNMQATSLADLKQWAINSADEIKSELKARETLRENYRKAKQSLFDQTNNKS